MYGTRHLGIAVGLMLAAMTVTGAAAHPLDGLSEAEIGAAVAILKKDGKADDATLFPYITLTEPAKAVVLAWKPGAPEARAATLYIRNRDGAFRAEVDLAAGQVIGFAPAAGETMVLFEEVMAATEVATKAPEFLAGLTRRGIDVADVFCLPLTAGHFGLPEEAGRRLMKVPCYVKPAGSNFYASPIEGLYVTVDLKTRQAVAVLDTGAVPVPTLPWGYTEAEVAQRPGGLRPKASPATLSQPGGRNFTVDGSLVAWDIWRFRYRADKRPGVVLSAIEVRDGEAWRSVLYQAHLSEVFVPYMDPAPGWYWRTYMDSGEYGFGLFLSPLRRGVDCPAHATFLPAVIHDDAGSPLTVPDAICIFERDIGDPAWRHFEIFAQSPDAMVPAEGRPATTLVVRSASSVGNYDYLIDYVFHQDGRIDIKVGATGIDAVKGTAVQSMDDPGAAEATRYGTLIAPGLVAPNHDHYFNFRLDFDVDGLDNTFMRTALVAGKPPAELPRRSYWVTESRAAATELDGRYRINPATPAMYHVMNMNSRGPLGHHAGYMIVPNDSVAYGPFDFAIDPPMKRNAYVEYTIWNTRYDPSEQYAGGEYAFQSDGSDTLAAWAERNRPIENTDIVTWYTMGLHHVPHAEDWPVMSTMWKGITLMPFNFFASNPALSIRAPQ